MNFTLTERETHWRDRVRDFVGRNLRPRAAEYDAEVGQGDRWKTLRVGHGGVLLEDVRVPVAAA